MTNERLLILLPSWIGDFIMSTPLLNAIRRFRSTTPIIAMGPSHITAALRKSSIVDETITSPLTPRTSLGKLYERSLSIRKSKPASALALPGSLGSALALWLARVPHRMGYSGYVRRALLTDWVPHPADFRHRHRVEYYMGLTSLFRPHEVLKAASPDSVPLCFEIDRPAHEWAKKYVTENASGRGPLIAVHMGGAYGSSKRWPVDRFAEVFRMLETTHGALRIIAVGSEVDRESAHELKKHLSRALSSITVAAGDIPGILELAALLDEADVVLSTDSGPMHIAAARRRPQVAIFTSTSSTFTAPWSAKALIVQSTLNCSPCFSRSCPHRRGDVSFPCHDSISPKKVTEFLVRALTL